MQVPFFRAPLGQDEIDAVADCIRSGWLTTGKINQKFEAAFGEALGDPSIHCISVNSATAGLHLAVEAIGVGPGDEVILPSLTFTATAEVVRYMGGIPVFCDIDPATLSIDPEKIEELITPKTKAIIPVHFGGRACDVIGLRKICDAHGLKMVDDAAHAFPTSRAGKMIGTDWADLTVFSFYANKTMTTGEGGMLVTRDEALAKRARQMRLHGIDRDVFDRFTNPRASWEYDVIAPGFKYNLTDVAAAIGNVQLSKAQMFRNQRAAAAEIYFELLADLPLTLPPRAAEGDSHSWHLFPVQIDDASIRDEAMLKLKRNGVGLSLHYRPLHRMTYWKVYDKGGLEHTDSYYDRAMSLPLFPDIKPEEQAFVVEQLKKAL